MQKSVTWLVCGVALAGFVLASMGHEAAARPPYLKSFTETYEKVKEEAQTVKCLACHGAESKKVRNDYGKAMGEALGGANIKDADKVVEALKKIEKEKSSVEGKTFGDLLAEGKLPGKKVE